MKPTCEKRRPESKQNRAVPLCVAAGNIKNQFPINRVTTTAKLDQAQKEAKSSQMNRLSPDVGFSGLSEPS
jgi:hypothetical protein